MFDYRNSLKFLSRAHFYTASVEYKKCLFTLARKIKIKEETERIFLLSLMAYGERQCCVIKIIRKFNWSISDRLKNLKFSYF